MTPPELKIGDRIIMLREPANSGERGKRLTDQIGRVIETRLTNTPPPLHWWYLIRFDNKSLGLLGENSDCWWVEEGSLAGLKGRMQSFAKFGAREIEI